jgi:hypothetical protein
VAQQQTQKWDVVLHSNGNMVRDPISTLPTEQLDALIHMSNVDGAKYRMYKLSWMALGAIHGKEDKIGYITVS